jgi:hypothetical protein
MAGLKDAEMIDLLCMKNVCVLMVFAMLLSGSFFQIFEEFKEMRVKFAQVFLFGLLQKCSSRRPRRRELGENQTFAGSLFGFCQNFGQVFPVG